MAKKWIHKDGESKIVDFHDVVEHYKKGWTDEVTRKEAMTEAEIESFGAKVKIDTSPCPTCGHRKAAPVVEVPAVEPVEEGEESSTITEPIEGLDVKDADEPADEEVDPYDQYTKAELIKMIEDEDQTANKNAKKEELIAALKFIKGE